MKKCKYCLIINKVSTNAIKYKYGYGNTKCIDIELSKAGASISVELTKKYEVDQILSSGVYLFPDALKKVTLLYLLHYNKPLTIHSITVVIDDYEETVFYNSKTNPLIYSLINEELIRKVPKEFLNESVVDYLLNTPKSKYGRRIASLFAFLFSKSKKYEAERFIYLWTSFNGMYGWLSDYIAMANNEKEYRSEFKQIVGILKYINEGNETIGDNAEKARIAHNVMSLLKGVDSEQISKSEIKHSDINIKIVSCLVKTSGQKYDLSAYGYLLTGLPYYLRCKTFHGNKPINLFSYADENDLHVLKVVNNLLEEYIENNLSLWFDDGYINNHIIPATKNIKLKK